MNIRSTHGVRTRKTVARAGLACAVLAFAAGAPAQPSIGASVCPVLAKLVPAVRGYKPEGARAQLVMAVGEKFDYDGVKLRQVRAEIDAATTAACPKEREAMLGVLKMKTLADALS